MFVNSSMVISLYITIGSPETRVFILVALARVNMTHWFYTRERHENKNTRFWATYDITRENCSKKHSKSLKTREV